MLPDVTFFEMVIADTAILIIFAMRLGASPTTRTSVAWFVNHSDAVLSIEWFVKTMTQPKNPKVGSNLSQEEFAKMIMASLPIMIRSFKCGTPRMKAKSRNSQNNKEASDWLFSRHKESSN